MRLNYKNKEIWESYFKLGRNKNIQNLNGLKIKIKNLVEFEFARVSLDLNSLEP